MKLTNEELNKIMTKADDDLERLKDRCHELYKENEKLKDLCNKYEEEHNTTFQEWKRVIEASEKAIDKIQYIIDYGFDYDGINTVDNLKKLIDMLVDYAIDSKKILQGEKR